MEANTEVLIALGLFVASEVIGMSRLRANSTIQLLLGIAVRAFPYELHRRSNVAPMLDYPEDRPAAPARRTTSSSRSRSRSTKAER